MSRFQEYASAMQRVEDAGVKSKSAADKLLAEVEPVSLLITWTFPRRAACSIPLRRGF